MKIRSQTIFFSSASFFEYLHLNARKKDIRGRIRAHDKPMSKEKKIRAHIYTNSAIWIAAASAVHIQANAEHTIRTYVLANVQRDRIVKKIMLKLKLEFIFESGIEKYERVRAYDREWAAAEKNRRKRKRKIWSKTTYDGIEKQ